MLSNKVCLVAGAGHGLGEAVAIELGKAGATVVVNDLGTSLSGEGEDAEPAKETAESVRKAGGQASVHFGDVSSLEYTEELVNDTYEKYGRIDGAVNFAGILRDAISYKMSGDEWDSVIRVHLRGHFSLLRNVAAHWRERNKESEEGLTSQRSFLAVSSGSALGNVGQINYSAAKAGILGLTRTAAKELYRLNVRANALMPVAYTRMVEQTPDERVPFTRGEKSPEKVAPVVAFLMSDSAEDITGCTVRADGDMVGLITNPKINRMMFKDDGWNSEEIASSFKDQLGNNLELKKLDEKLL